MIIYLYLDNEKVQLSLALSISIQGDSKKLLQRVFSFIIGDTFILLFTNKTTSFEVFNRDNFFP